MKNKIAKFILEAEEYPTMKELIEEFITCSSEDIHVLNAIQELRSEGTIMYDNKHDIWIYTAADTPELRKLVRESVRLDVPRQIKDHSCSDTPTEGEK